MSDDERDYNLTWEELIENRSPEVQAIVSHFEYGHLPEGGPREVSAHATGMMIEMVQELKDGPELVAGLRKLLEAKDCFVRQAIVDRGERP